MKLVTRADWGGPATINVPKLPVRQGMAVHYNGPATNLAGKDHSSCLSYWKGTHNYHVNTNGWSAIGYAWGVCPHGYVFEGRGFDCDQAAQGDPGNQTHQAVQFMLGGDERPTDGMLQAWYDLRADLRSRGVGAEIRPHSSFLSTSCPGDHLRGLISDGTLAKDVQEPVQEAGMYTVQKGDTLWGIARKFNVTVVKLVEWNDIRNADQIEVGQKLRVESPVRESNPFKEPGHNYGRIRYDGRVINVRTREMLEDANRHLGRDPGTVFDLSQGSYNTSVSASAGTHAGGGVIDVASSSWTVAKALRQAGFAAWVRTPSEGPWGYHIHAVAIGDRELSASAARQETAYFNGRNALANNRADTAPSWVGRPYPDWAKKYK